MKAQRILLFVTQADWGGVQSFLLHFAEDLLREGRTVLLAAGGEGELWERAAAKNIPTHRLQHVVREINPLKDVQAILEIRQLIKDFHPDTIHLNSSKMSIVGSIAAATIRPQPHTVYRIGGWSFLEPTGIFNQTIHRLAETITAPLKDTIVTVHPGDEALAKQNNIRPRKHLITIPNGLDIAAFVSHLLPRAAARATLNIPEHAFVYGTIAGAYSTKALLSYLKILERVLAEDTHAYAVIIGDGPEFTDMLRLRDTLKNHERIILPGYIDGTPLYSAFDAFVLPSRKEGMPWTILEAIAAGVPVIATDVGACRWMVEKNKHGKAGIIVPPNDPLALQEALHVMRTHAEERTAYAQTARLAGNSRFSWETTYRGHRDTLDQVFTKNTTVNKP